MAWIFGFPILNSAKFVCHLQEFTVSDKTFLLNGVVVLLSSKFQNNKLCRILHCVIFVFVIFVARRVKPKLFEKDARAIVIISYEMSGSSLVLRAPS